MIDVHHHTAPPLARLRRPPFPQAGVEIDDDTLGLASGASLDLPTALVDDAERLTAMDAAGIDLALLSPVPHLQLLHRPASDQVAVSRTVNDDTLSRASEHPRRLLAAVQLPLGDVDAALVELDRCTEAAHAVLAPPLVAGGSLAGDGRDRLLSAIAERDLPLLLHPDVPDARADDPLAGAVGFPHHTGRGLAHLLLDDGLPDGLDLLAVHGGGTLPWLMDRLAHATDDRRRLRSRLRRLHVDLLTHGQAGTDLLLAQLGPDALLLGTDAPFPVGEPAGAQLTRIDDTLHHAVSHTNARRLLRLPTTAT